MAPLINIIDLESHIELVHNGIKLTCELCNKQFITLRDQKRHIYMIIRQRQMGKVYAIFAINHLIADQVCMPIEKEYTVELSILVTTATKSLHIQVGLKYIWTQCMVMWDINVLNVISNSRKDITWRNIMILCTREYKISVQNVVSLLFIRVI